MKNINEIIKKLLEINYTNYNDDPNYKEEAYEILDKLNKKELIEIVETEEIYINKNSNVGELKCCIFDNLVRFRCDIQALGLIAEHEGIFKG